MTTETKAFRAANKVAKEKFDDYLSRSRCTAAGSVPEFVVVAAVAAYREAGGTGEIIVRGYGNTTHPVCGVEVAYESAEHH